MPHAIFTNIDPSKVVEEEVDEEITLQAEEDKEQQSSEAPWSVESSAEEVKSMAEQIREHVQGTPFENIETTPVVKTNFAEIENRVLANMAPNIEEMRERMLGSVVTTQQAELALRAFGQAAGHMQIEPPKYESMMTGRFRGL